MTGTNDATRLPRNRRAPLQQLPAMRLTERDRQIVLMVYDYRAVTAAMVETVLFAPKPNPRAPVDSRCLHRLKLLYHHGYVARFPLAHGRGSFVYMLDARGAELLAELLSMPVAELDWKPQDSQMVRGPFIDHMLLTNAVRAAVEVGVRSRNAAVANWQDDKTIRRAPIRVTIPGKQQGRQVELVPDSFFYLVQNDHAQPCFIELDRGTEIVRSNTGAKDFAGKVRAYLALARTRPLRVLTVVAAGEQRMANLRHVAAQLGDRGVFLFASFNHAADPTLAVAGRIWRKSHEPTALALLP
jgi:hypothetical protein